MGKVYQVLVVDDDPGVLAAYKHALKKVPGVNPHLVKNRAGAQRLLKNFHFTKGVKVDPSNLIAISFIDQKLMGDYDPKVWHGDIEGAEGLAMVPYIKRFSPLTRVLMVTAFQGTPEDQGFLAGRDRADGYIKKVNDPKGITNAIRNICKEEIARFEEAVKFYNMRLETAGK
ncbi:MAG: hypothetical protein HQL67_11090 [Magnetococcales bacterium]|nr:hypothetical protein [Magnetococcales bacterium]